MKIINEDGLGSFEAWQGAISTKNTIVEAGMVEAFDSLIEELYPDGIEEVQLNDLLWFEEDWLFESLGINEENDSE